MKCCATLYASLMPHTSADLTPHSNVSSSVPSRIHGSLACISVPDLYRMPHVLITSRSKHACTLRCYAPTQHRHHLHMGIDNCSTACIIILVVSSSAEQLCL
mmetsp:Transcript_12833/g.32846  ORF Transcript_12833/g.32846 Transcript_12833/m.32846 type:complete len:102 (-) Transcript_12833:222-527(-)